MLVAKGDHCRSPDTAHSYVPWCCVYKHTDHEPLTNKKKTKLNKLYKLNNTKSNYNFMLNVDMEINALSSIKDS